MQCIYEELSIGQHDSGVGKGISLDHIRESLEWLQDMSVCPYLEGLTDAQLCWP